MKERELREHAVCSLCHKRILSTGLPLFWTAELKHYGIDMRAMERQQGLGMQLGASLAMVMGPDEDMAQCIDTVTLTICENCSTDHSLPIGAMVECAEEANHE